MLQRYRTELKKIAANPLFEEFGNRTGANRIEILTKPLHCTFEGKRRRIGPMRITMDFSSYRICWFNLESTRSLDFYGQTVSMQAPGVDADGEAFDKSLLAKTCSLLGRGQLAQAFQLALNYVQQLSPLADWASNAALWPEVEEGELS